MFKYVFVLALVLACGSSGWVGTFSGALAVDCDGTPTNQADMNLAITQTSDGHLHWMNCTGTADAIPNGDMAQAGPWDCPAVTVGSNTLTITNEVQTLKLSEGYITFTETSVQTKTGSTPSTCNELSRGTLLRH